MPAKETFELEIKTSLDLGEANKQTEQLGKNFDDTAKSADMSSEALDQLQKAAKETSDEAKETSKQLQNISKSGDDLEGSMRDLEKRTDKAGESLEDLEKDSRDLRKAIDVNVKSVTDWSSKLSNLTNIAGGAISGLSALSSGVFGFLEGIENAARESTRFEFAIRNISSALKLTSSDMALLQGAISNLSRDTGKSDGELAEYASRFTAFGATARESIQLVTAALNISRDTGKELTVVVQAIADGLAGSPTTLSQMGIAVSQFTPDLLASGGAVREILAASSDTIQPLTATSNIIAEIRDRAEELKRRFFEVVGESKILQNVLLTVNDFLKNATEDVPELGKTFDDLFLKGIRFAQDFRDSVSKLLLETQLLVTQIESTILGIDTIIPGGPDNTARQTVLAVRDAELQAKIDGYETSKASTFEKYGVTQEELTKQIIDGTRNADGTLKDIHRLTDTIRLVDEEVRDETVKSGGHLSELNNTNRTLSERQAAFNKKREEEAAAAKMQRDEAQREAAEFEKTKIAEERDYRKRFFDLSVEQQVERITTIDDKISSLEEEMIGASEAEREVIKDEITALKEEQDRIVKAVDRGTDIAKGSADDMIKQAKDLDRDRLQDLNTISDAEKTVTSTTSKQVLAALGALIGIDSDGLDRLLKSGFTFHRSDVERDAANTNAIVQANIGDAQAALDTAQFGLQLGRDLSVGIGQLVEREGSIGQVVADGLGFVSTLATNVVGGGIAAASAGSAIPGVGTAVGGAVGATVGLVKTLGELAASTNKSDEERRRDNKRLLDSFESDARRDREAAIADRKDLLQQFDTNERKLLRAINENGVRLSDAVRENRNPELIETIKGQGRFLEERLKALRDEQRLLNSTVIGGIKVREVTDPRAGSRGQALLAPTFQRPSQIDESSRFADGLDSRFDRFISDQNDFYQRSLEEDTRRTNAVEDDGDRLVAAFNKEAEDLQTHRDQIESILTRGLGQDNNDDFIDAMRLVFGELSVSTLRQIETLEDLETAYSDATGTQIGLEDTNQRLLYATEAQTFFQERREKDEARRAKVEGEKKDAELKQDKTISDKRTDEAEKAFIENEKLRGTLGEVVFQSEYLAESFGATGLELAGYNVAIAQQTEVSENVVETIMALDGSFGVYTGSITGLQSSVLGLDETFKVNIPYLGETQETLSDRLATMTGATTQQTEETTLLNTTSNELKNTIFGNTKEVDLLTKAQNLGIDTSKFWIETTIAGIKVRILNTQALKENTKRVEESQRRQSSGGGFFGGLLRFAAGAIGTVIGGPLGGFIGGSLGSAVTGGGGGGGSNEPFDFTQSIKDGLFETLKGAGGTVLKNIITGGNIGAGLTGDLLENLGAPEIGKELERLIATGQGNILAGLAVDAELDPEIISALKSIDGGIGDVVTATGQTQEEIIKTQTQLRELSGDLRGLTQGGPIAGTQGPLPSLFGTSGISLSTQRFLDEFDARWNSPENVRDRRERQEALDRYRAEEEERVRESARLRARQRSAQLRAQRAAVQAEKERREAEEKRRRDEERRERARLKFEMETRREPFQVTEKNEVAELATALLTEIRSPTSRRQDVISAQQAFAGDFALPEEKFPVRLQIQIGDRRLNEILIDLNESNFQRIAA